MMKRLINPGCTALVRHFQCQQNMSTAVSVTNGVIKVEDCPVNLMCRRDEMITDIQHRFPNVQVSVPKLNTLHRQDITTSHPAIATYLDHAFSHYSSKKVHCHTDGVVDRQTFLTGRKRMRDKFTFPHSISLSNDGSGVVFVTGHQTEIDMIVGSVEGLLRKSSMVSKRIRLPLDELKTFQTLSGGILSNTEKRQIGIDNGELVITCADHDQLTSLKQKVKQIIKYGSSPVKGSVWINYLTMYKILSSSRLHLDCVWVCSDRQTAILLGASTEAQIASAKDRILNIMKTYTMKGYKNTPQDVFSLIVKKHLDYLDKQNNLEYFHSPHADTTFEITFKKTNSNVFRILRHSFPGRHEVVPLPPDLASRDLEVLLSERGDQILPVWSEVGDLGHVFTKEGVVLFGATKGEQRRCKQDLVTFLAGLEIVRVEIPEPHDKYHRFIESVDLYSQDGVNVILNDDSISVIGPDKVSVAEVADKIRGVVDGLGVGYFSRLRKTGVLYHTDMAQFNLTDSPVTLQELHPSDRIQSWALYGPLDHVTSAIARLSGEKRAFFSGKVTRTVRAVGYDTWHRFLLHAEHVNLTNPTVGCMFGEVDGEPGVIQMLGPPNDTEKVVGEFEEIKLGARNPKHSSDEGSTDTDFYQTVVVGLARSSKDLRLASLHGISFPNTSIRTTPEKNGLVIKGDNPASRQLAEQHVRGFFEDAYSGETRYLLRNKHWDSFHKCYKQITAGLNRICSTHKVHYRMTLTKAEHSLRLFGPSNTIPSVVEEVDGLLVKILKSYRNDIRYPLTTPSSLVRTDTALIQHLPAHVMGIKSRRSVEETLVVRELDLGGVSGSVRENVSAILQNMYPVSSGQVKLDLNPTGSLLTITAASKLKMEATEPKIKQFLKVNTHYEEIELPTLKLGAKLEGVKMLIARLDLEMADKKTPPMIYLDTTKDHDYRVAIVGNETEVIEIRDQINDVLQLDQDWTTVHYENLNFDRSQHLSTLKKRILQMFPWLMVNFEEKKSRDGHVTASIKVHCPVKVLRKMTGGENYVAELDNFLSSYSFSVNKKNNEFRSEKKV